MGGWQKAKIAACTVGLSLIMLFSSFKAKSQQSESDSCRCRRFLTDLADSSEGKRQFYFKKCEVLMDSTINALKAAGVKEGEGELFMDEIWKIMKERKMRYKKGVSLAQSLETNEWSCDGIVWFTSFSGSGAGIKIETVYSKTGSSDTLYLHASLGINGVHFDPSYALFEFIEQPPNYPQKLSSKSIVFRTFDCCAAQEYASLVKRGFKRLESGNAIGAINDFLRVVEMSSGTDPSVIREICEEVAKKIRSRQVGGVGLFDAVAELYEKALEKDPSNKDEYLEYIDDIYLSKHDE